MKEERDKAKKENEARAVAGENTRNKAAQERTRARKARGR
jgi:hypothetical protein